ncbi:major capsid protein [Paenibacillus shunpengii]|uniref:Major capsid protein n=1 Tax=Paenibacillus shunpengii TaxID=2054424 RepID=A0ABW5SVK4_9BACL
MPTIFDLVDSKNIATYYTDSAAASNAIPYLGSILFPAKKRLGLDLSWIKGGGGLPVALKPSAFDAKAPIRERIGFKKLSDEMPFFREAMKIGEKDRQELNKLLASSNAAYYEPLINQIYDDRANLIKGALVNPERMIMQMLSTGKIAITAERQNLEYDFKLPSEHKITLGTGAKWNESDSTPIQDITEWMDQVEDDTGVRPTRAICTRKTWGYLLQNKSIRLDMNPIGGNNIIMTDNMLKQYLLAKLGLQVSVYNKKYANESGVATNFYPDEMFTLVPEGDLGNTWFGTTPEESDLMSGQTNASVQIVETGIAVTTIKEPHPVNVETIVSEIVLPSFEKIDQIFIAQVG